MNQKPLDFFLPFEFDTVPKVWDPWEDTWDPNEKKNYIWECFEKPPFDGILISKSKFDDNKNRLKSIENNKNLKDALKLPKEIKLFGDCGAFQYRNEKIPPYTEEEILNYYQEFGFDMGCSIDHIITNKKNRKLREQRYQITTKFAEVCLDLYKSGNYSFDLFGVAQGWDINSYKKSVDYLLELGYKNVCIGGLVGVNKKKPKNPKDLTVKNLINNLKPQFKQFKKVHLFGRGDIDLFELYIKSGVTQYDSNIMRKAWTDKKKSYFFFDKEKNNLSYYTSIRIPLIRRKQGIHKKEKEIFKKLKQLNEEQISNEIFIEVLKKYYYQFKIFKNKKYDINIKLTKELLNDKPWKKCNCELCKANGIQICIFRRRVRNSRRAFHNVYNYYLYLKNLRTREK